MIRNPVLANRVNRPCIPRPSFPSNLLPDASIADTTAPPPLLVHSESQTLVPDPGPLVQGLGPGTHKLQLMHGTAARDVPLGAARPRTAQSQRASGSPRYRSGHASYDAPLLLRPSQRAAGPTQSAATSTLLRSGAAPAPNTVRDRVPAHLCCKPGVRTSLAYLSWPGRMNPVLHQFRHCVPLRDTTAQ